MSPDRPQSTMPLGRSACFRATDCTVAGGGLAGVPQATARTSAISAMGRMAQSLTSRALSLPLDDPLGELARGRAALEQIALDAQLATTLDLGRVRVVGQHHDGDVLQLRALANLLEHAEAG